LKQRHRSGKIIKAVLKACDPSLAVGRAVQTLQPCNGRTLLLAVGKAAVTMAAAALRVPGFSVDRGLAVTKYGHADPAVLAALPEERRRLLRIREAGHPIADSNSYAAAEEAIAMVQGLDKEDRVLLLLSGGGSALFEKPLLPPEEMADINRQLLACGAKISEINTIRKRLSRVKGGRFAALCAPAQVVTVALSDVLGDDPASIASGPACPDPTTCADAISIVERYGLRLGSQALSLLAAETPKSLPNASVQVVGGMGIARAAAARACTMLGYRTKLFLPALTGEAAAAGRFFGALAGKARRENRSLAIVAGGETVVRLGRVHGLGGRNQEAALAAAPLLRGLDDCCFFSLGTDGTDGPTDAAGGYADGETAGRLAACGISPAVALRRHDAYHALQSAKGLLFTGPTGTNVNDVCVVLVGSGSPRARSGQTGEKQREYKQKH